MQKKKKGQNGKKNSQTSPEWLLTCPNDAKVDGFTEMDFSFLHDWVGIQKGKEMLLGMQRFADGYSAAASVYSVRKVLKLWARDSESKEAIEAGELSPIIASLARLRQEVFSSDAREGNRISTSAGNWHGFLNAIPFLSAAKALPRIDVKNPRVAAPPSFMVSATRIQASQVDVPGVLAPKNYRFDNNSYNDELFVDISIVASDIEYLNDYEQRLEHAVNCIRDAALKDFEKFEALHEEGTRLARKMYPQIADKEDEDLFLDSISKTDMYLADERTIGLMVNFVNNKMDGIPKAWALNRTYASERPSRCRQSDCDKLARFGKNNLLPYLGIFNSSLLGVCLILLIIEHPKLNAMSLLRAELESADGKKKLITSTTVNGKKAKRLTVQKPRAKKEISVVLSPLALRVIEKVLDWTTLVRKELIAEGRTTLARRLWVGMNQRSYKLAVFSAQSMLLRDSGRVYGKTADPGRLEFFADRHPQLAPWISRLNLKSLRKNVGVLEFLRSDGDLVRTAEVLGHEDVSTTIDNYIPKALRLAIYERQIRRHQNLLIAAAYGEGGPPLEVMDFKTKEELHLFLANVFEGMRSGNVQEDGIREAIGRHLGRIQGGQKESSEFKDQSADGRLVLTADPKSLCVAMLYREHLKLASSLFLDKADVVTGVPPRFWCEFIDSISGDIPHAMAEVRHVVSEARNLIPTYVSKVHFPRIM